MIHVYGVSREPKHPPNAGEDKESTELTAVVVKTADNCFVPEYDFIDSNVNCKS